MVRLLVTQNILIQAACASPHYKPSLTPRVNVVLAFRAFVPGGVLLLRLCFINASHPAQTQTGIFFVVLQKINEVLSSKCQYIDNCISCSTQGL